MSEFNNLSYTEKIKWRIHFLRLTLVSMLVYMVIISEAGGGDSRIMTDFAENVSRLIFFGGLIYIIYRICQDKKLLENRLLLKQQMLIKYDERNKYLHEKSGGIVVDFLLIALLFITFTSSLFNMAAFYVSVIVLALTAILKTAVYFIYSRVWQKE